MRRLRRLRGGDRGSSALEVAVLTPVLLLLVLGVVQVAVYYHARNVALSAAQHGVDVGRVSGSVPGAGGAAAAQFAAGQGGGVLTGVTASTAGSDARSVRVQVRGTAIRIMPFVPLGVDQTAAGAVERYTTPGDR